MSKKALIIIISSIIAFLILVGLVVAAAFAIVGARNDRMSARQNTSQSTGDEKQYEVLNACKILSVNELSQTVGKDFKRDDRVDDNNGETKGTGSTANSYCYYRTADSNVVGSARVLVDSPRSAFGAKFIKESFETSMSNRTDKEDLSGVGEIAFYGTNTAYVFNKGYRYAVFVSVPELSDEKVKTSAIELVKKAIE